jgi:hypothetical protein
MPLPRAVQEAAARAEELQKQLQQPAAPQQPSAPAPDAPTTEPTPPKEDAPEPPKPEAKPTAEPPEGTWKKKFDVLTGKYNAEVPRLAAELRETSASLKRALAEIEVLKTRAPAPESLLKPEEIQEFGEPLIDVTRRVAREVARGTESELAEVKRKLERFEVNETKNVEQKFYEELATAVPDWPVINDDEGFHAWLREVDPFAGKTRQQLLEDAEGARDAKRVANFFTNYKAGIAQEQATARSKLEEQIAPDSGTPSSAPPAKRIWTRREIAAFYAQWRRGGIPSEKAVAIEAEIQKATLEGRIR